jgi:hypothetical protein
MNGETIIERNSDRLASVLVCEPEWSRQLVPFLIRRGIAAKPAGGGRIEIDPPMDYETVRIAIAQCPRTQYTAAP